jgi:hypothetical protein
VEIPYHETPQGKHKGELVLWDINMVKQVDQSTQFIIALTRCTRWMHLVWRRPMCGSIRSRVWWRDEQGAFKEVTKANITSVIGK